MSLSASALRRPVTTVAAVLAFVLLGSVSLTRLPVSLLPDITLPVLTVRTAYPGAAATEVSRLVAEPVEQAVAATPGLVEVRSVSRSGEATTTLRFGWGTDMPKTILLVRERLDNVRRLLPENAERPTLLTSDPGERPIAVLGLTSPGDLRSIALTAEDVHARRLEQISGVASVAVVGAPEDEIRVDVNPERARALGITPNQVADAIKTANVTARGGTIRRGQFRFSMRALTEFQTLDEVLDTPVGPEQSGIRLRDVAAVSLQTAEAVTTTRLDGAPAVGLVVYKDAGSNTVAVTRGIYKTIEELAAEFPEVTVQVVAAQAEFVTSALSNLAQEIIVGGLLSLLSILLFMQHGRSAFAIGLIVPLSVLIALVLLQILNVTINILSLGGLALGVGLLVDNAIVVAEATGRLREEGVPPLEAARRAAEEVSGPLIAGTLTTLLVFGPIVFVQGLGAALFRDLSLSVVTSLTASLVLALTLMPVLMVGRAGAISSSTGFPGFLAGPMARLRAFGNRMADRYETGMDWSLHHAPRVLIAGLIISVVTVWLTLQLPREILPSVEERIAVAELRLPVGTALEETTRQAGRLETAARDLGSRGIYARAGLATDEEILAGADPGTSATAQLLIPVPEGQSAAAFAARLRTMVPDLAAGALAIDLAGQSEFGSLIGREGRLVRVEVSAAATDEAELWADAARERLAAMPTLTDVRDAFSATQPAIEIQLRRERIAERGISIEEVASVLAGGLGGVVANDFRETDRRTPIMVRFHGDANEDLATALATPIQGVPVGQLVTVVETRTPIEVVRINQRPVVVVEGVVEEGGTARAAKEVQASLGTLPVPPGLTWALSGADAEQQRTMRELSLVAFLSVALVFLVLAGEFGSFTTPLVIMTVVPLAGTGSIVALWLTGQSLNAVAMIGIVVMIGIADNDAVVKIDAINRFRERGHSLREAILLGGRQRLRAITMTSLTTILGVTPMLLGVGAGGELYQPLAAAVIGGSVTALLVTFFLLPSAYYVMERGLERRAARRESAGLSTPAVETAS